MAGALRLTEQFINMYDGELNLMPYDYIPPVDIKTEPYIPETAHGPYIQIIEEPKQRGFRFRYECEGPSHGGLPGASSEKNRRTFPTVKIGNYVGPARVEVELVTHTDPPRVHAHSLVGRNCTEMTGMCSMDVGPNDLTASFSNLGILHVTKKSVVEVLTRRLREERRKQRGTHTHLTDAEETLMLKEAKDLGKVMDLNIVRLRFTAFLQDSNGSFSRALKPVVSNPIYDSKSPNASNLKISRLDKTCGSVLGGDEVFLLCDKVQKDDIEIRFFEEDEEGSWEAFGDFSPTDVHKQYAIVFKTPAYHSTEIERPVTVFLQLRRKKAGDSSDPKQFTYIPQVQDKEEVLRKKLKPLPPYEPWRGAGAGGGARGRGGGATGGFPFHQMNGSSYFGGFSGFGDGGGAQMSDGQRNALLQIAAVLQAQRSQSAKTTAEALLRYCRTGNVQELLNLQRNLCGVQDENGDTPLHLAIIHQQTSVTNQLINILLSSNQSAVLNSTNHLQQTPLHLAVIGRQVKVVEVLLRGGVDPSIQDQQGHAPLHLAALSGDHVMLRLLLSHLRESHAHLVNTPDFKGLHPLHLAVRRDGERCLRLLVETGAKVNAPELSSGNTALMMAVRDDLFKVACTLITELKADVNSSNYSGNTPLHFAANQGSPTLCSMLIAAGADKSVENDEPLFISSSDEEDESMTDKNDELDALLQPIRCRKRPGGHTPLDLAKCQKVRKLLSCTQSPSRHSKKIRKSHGSAPSTLDEQTLSRLQSVLSVDGVSWRTLADKLGMMTLTHLYQESPAPCQQLLHHYQLGGGAVEGLIEALQSLGVTEGVRLLRHKELNDNENNTEATVDSGFSSQPMEEGEEHPVANQ